MDRVFLIDLNGNIIEDPAISSHVGLAIKIINEDKELKEKFIASGYENHELFLVEQIGYTLGSSSKYDQFLIINKEKATKAQKQTAYRFVQEGYSFCFCNEKNNSRSI